MRLIEIVTSPDTDAGVAAKVEQFVDHRMGKRIVRAKDTPGFIANRIGTYWLAIALNAALDQGADRRGGGPDRWAADGRAQDRHFGLLDLVGIDLMPLLAKSLSSTLPEGDAYFDTIRPLPLIDKMIAEGFTGRKGKGGFYRLDKKPDGTKAKQSLDLQTGEYRPEKKPDRLPGRAEGFGRVGRDAGQGRRYAGRSRVLSCPMRRVWSARRPTMWSRSMTR